MTVSPLERDVLPRLRCLACGGRPHHRTADGVACDACGRELPVREGVLYARAANEDGAVIAERDAVLAIERNRQPGDEGFGFEQVLGDEALQRALLTLPYGEAHVPTYGSYFHEVSKFAASFDFVLGQLAVTPPACVLDIGADLTWSTAQLARRGYRPIGIDINHHLEAAGPLGRLATPYAVVNTDMHSAAFGDGVFDAITAFNALHHSAKLGALAANLGRMLRPGGRLGFIEAYWYYAQARESFGVEQIAAGINENVYRLEEWHAAFVAAGLELLVFAAGRSFDAVYERTGRPGRVLTREAAVRELFERYYDVSFSVPTSAVAAVAGVPLDVDVVVHNRGQAAWLSDSQVPVFASYHLQAGDGALVAFDNVRTALPGHVAPGADTRLRLRLEPPSTPGAYRIEVDLVHEGVTWFRDRGGRTATFSLVVSAP